MMKRLILFFFLLSFLGFLFADLIGVYKKGEIKIIPGREFGKNTDWDLLMYKGIRSISFAPDGSFFVVGIGQHKIFRFDINGNLIKTFGKKGKGPGDFVSPGDLSILDDKYLVVGEYALNRRISLFDFNGKFVKLIKTNYSVFNSFALKNKIAILSQRTLGENENHIITHHTILIKDLVTGKDIEVVSLDEKRENVYRGGGYVLVPGTFFGRVSFEKIDDTKFLVGFSDTPDISIYSSDGAKLSSFKVNFERRQVTSDMKKRFIKKYEDRAKTDARLKNHMKILKPIIFPEYTPYYSEVRVDSDHNILVYKWHEGNNIKDATFQVYSNKGQYICETKIESGNFEPAYPYIFYKNYAYFILKKIGTDDFSLGKVELK